MEKKDILGTNKVRTKPEYTARTHWAGSVNFAAIFTAPVFYLLLPVLVLYVTGCFKMIANLINNLAGSAIFDQYGVMGIVALLLWQIVVCWIVWLKQVKAYESAPKYKYLFYSDIVERENYKPTEPKIIKTLKFLINLIPTIVILGVLGIIIYLIIDSLPEVEPSPLPTPTPNPTPDPTPNPTPDPSPAFDFEAILAAIGSAFKAIWDAIQSAFEAIKNFYRKDQPPFNRGIKITATVVATLALGSPFYKPLLEKVKKLCKVLWDLITKKREKEVIPPKSIPARTLHAIVSVVKKLPAPAYVVPDNCPLWLRKIIFWAPVRYNYGDVIISSPKGLEDDLVLSKIEAPEELVNYLAPIKPQPTEVVGYSANK